MVTGRSKIFSDSGYELVIGVDEVGRGALAGPVVAGAVAFLAPTRIIGIKDSKKLTAKTRETLAKLIKAEARWGIGEVGVGTINRVGIVKATEKAMRQAVAKVRQGKCQVLVDAFHVKYIPGVGLKNQQAIIKGDEKVLEISAASIIAKVYRDALMAKIKNRYGWKRNKGYGTVEHIRALKKFGVTRLHRLAFVKKLV